MKNGASRTSRPVARTPFAPVLQYDSQGVTAELVERYSLGELGWRDSWSSSTATGRRSTPGSRSLPRGVTIESLASAMRTKGDTGEGHLSRYVHFAEHSFAALNTAFMQDGVFVHLSDGTTHG